ncbi:MAG: hypothetical protein AAB443_01300 [Patescibacteria group bacterium]
MEDISEPELMVVLTPGPLARFCSLLNLMVAVGAFFWGQQALFYVAGANVCLWLWLVRFRIPVERKYGIEVIVWSNLGVLSALSRPFYQDYYVTRSWRYWVVLVFSFLHTMISLLAAAFLIYTILT